MFSPDNLIGRTFLLPQQEDGQQFRAQIVAQLEDNESELEENPSQIKFQTSINDGQFEELLSFAEIVKHINDAENNNGDALWQFKHIISHEGPLRPDHPNYKGSLYNVTIEWENGEVMDEPLGIIGADAPVVCAIYAKDNGLLDTPGWKRFKRLANRAKKMLRMVNQAKLRSYNTAPKYKYGFEVPRDYKHALQLDERNGNTRWQDATKLEMSQLDDYATFKESGRVKPNGYKQIRVHLVFDVKHDGRHKARLVANGHLTDLPLESVYSGVVSICGI